MDSEKVSFNYSMCDNSYPLSDQSGMEQRMYDN